MDSEARANSLGRVSTLITVVVALGAAAVGAALGVGYARRRRQPDKPGLSRVDTHLSATAVTSSVSPSTPAALRRDVQLTVETMEAVRDLAVLDRILRDVRDLTGADEAIFWRWIESRDTLVPSAWSTEGSPRPEYFDVRGWAPLVRWSAEERVVHFAGDVDGAPQLAAAPVASASRLYGAITISSALGLGMDRDNARAWMPRFAEQLVSVLDLFDIRREYGRHMRQGEALLDAVQRLHGHRSAEALANAISETARDVTSATVAGLVRWNPTERVGVLQSSSAALDLEPGFHITSDSMIAQACAQGLPVVLEDARKATAESDPYGGPARPIGSMAIVPIMSDKQAIGAVIVEGVQPGDVSQHEARNVGLLVALARGPLEIVWEIEEVTLRARTDALTGLSNRRHFDEQLRRVVAETDRFGGNCSLILVDLDHFKQVNDKHGHEAGDTVLKHVAKVLCDAVRTVDVCARYGGEEIAILLPQTAPDGAAELAERLRTLVAAKPAVHGGLEIPVTASFGVASYPAPVPYGDWLFLAADKALYMAKSAGRNCVKVIMPSDVTPALYKSRR